jgi:hypothetical protein
MTFYLRAGSDDIFSFILEKRGFSCVRPEDVAHSSDDDNDDADADADADEILHYAAGEADGDWYREWSKKREQARETMRRSDRRPMCAVCVKAREWVFAVMSGDRKSRKHGGETDAADSKVGVRCTGVIVWDKVHAWAYRHCQAEDGGDDEGKKSSKAKSQSQHAGWLFVDSISKGPAPCKGPGIPPRSALFLFRGCTCGLRRPDKTCDGVDAKSEKHPLPDVSQPAPVSRKRDDDKAKPSARQPRRRGRQDDP